MRVIPVLLAMVLICGSIQAETHTVKPGESLWLIAERAYGSGKKWRRIWMANRSKIRNPDRIRPGQRLTIPPSGPQKPQVPRGDVPAGYRYWKTIQAAVRAYDPGPCCCQKDANGKTAIGDNAWVMDGAAVAFSVIPKRTMMKIPGAGWKEADDTGPSPKRGARRGQYRIEIRMRTHRKAENWGKQRKRVKLYRKVRKSVSGSVLKRKSPQS